MTSPDCLPCPMFKTQAHLVLAFSLFILLFSCKSQEEKRRENMPDFENVDVRPFAEDALFAKTTTRDFSNMALIPAGTFEMGADNDQAAPDEYPKHRVKVDSFYMDLTEVTNAEFARFVEATGYITTAEKEVIWEEMQKTLPMGTPRPPDSLLQPAALVFQPAKSAVNLDDVSQWWHWTLGANWRQPQGPGSNLRGKENHPVIQVSWYDAIAYCKWAGKRLPTEAEWEYAARGGLVNNIYAWGNEHVDHGKAKANSWDGEFPYKNDQRDGFLRTAPVKHYEPNGYGLYDMSGNVWEWTTDRYDFNYYESLKGIVAVNPRGSHISYDPYMHSMDLRSIRGGSFLCNDTYCSGYRVSRRMKSSPDTGLENTGFRCVADVPL